MKNKQKKIIKKIHQSLRKNGRFILTEQDVNFAFKTFYTKFKEFIMVKILKLTSEKTLKKHFKKIKIVSIDKQESRKLYLCIK